MGKFVAAAAIYSEGEDVNDNRIHFLRVYEGFTCGSRADI